MKTIRTAASAIALGVVITISAANPYLPLWEHIPDGEPYLFDDPDRPGHKRVYIYGSHDMLKTMYCGTDQVVWSADPDSLDTWRYDGVIFEVRTDADGNLLHPDGNGDVLFAPDVAVKTLPDGRKEYYLYPNNQAGGRNGMVARSARPDGPFEVINWNPDAPGETVGVLGFDPAVFVDDDGRVYGYWGFDKSYGAELDPATMATVKPGTEIVNLIPGRKDDDTFRFFEASSMRKIKDKYVLIYSRWTKDGDFGMPQTNYTLAYAYSDNPLGPFTYGGTIIDARGRDTDAAGNPIATATPSGNTHGSILEINGKWWVFFHRQTGLDEYNRQAMVAPVEVSVEPGPGGKVSISEGEYTSEGFETDGLDPLRRYPAAIASHFTGPTPSYQAYPGMHYSGSYIQPVSHRDHRVADPYGDPINVNPVINNVKGSTVGYKYYNFDRLAGVDGPVDLVLDIFPGEAGGTITVYTSAPWKGSPVPVGRFEVAPGQPFTGTPVRADVSAVKKLKGKHPLYLVFDSPEADKSVCTLTHLRFEPRK